MCDSPSRAELVAMYTLSLVSHGIKGLKFIDRQKVQKYCNIAVQ